MRGAPHFAGVPGVRAGRSFHRQYRRAVERRTETAWAGRPRDGRRLRASESQRGSARCHQNSRRTGCRGRRDAGPGSFGGRRLVRTAVRVPFHRAGPGRQKAVPTGHGRDRCAHRSGDTGSGVSCRLGHSAAHAGTDRLAGAEHCHRRHRLAGCRGCRRGLAVVAATQRYAARFRLDRCAAAGGGRGGCGARRARGPAPVHRRPRGRGDDLRCGRRDASRDQRGSHRGDALRCERGSRCRPDVAVDSGAVAGHVDVGDPAAVVDPGSDDRFVVRPNPPAILRFGDRTGSVPARRWSADRRRGARRSRRRGGGSQPGHHSARSGDQRGRKALQSTFSPGSA